MRRLLVLLLLLIPWSATAQQNVIPFYDNSPLGGSSQQKVDSGTHPLPVSSFGGGSAATPTTTYNKNLGVSTFTKTDVTLTGASQTLLAASNTRTGFTVYNPTTNASVYIELSGGTAVSDAASQIPSGATFSVAGSFGPKTAVTIVGTIGQHVYVQEGN